MTGLSVALVDVGERLHLEEPALLLDELAQTLNSRQSYFEFSVIDSISAEALGEPGVKGRYYDLGLLFETLLAHRKADQYDLVVGFTHFEITEGDRKQYDARRQPSRARLRIAEAGGDDRVQRIEADG